MTNPESKVWLITGASSGFGKRLVMSAIARGDCAIASARSLEKLESLVAGPEFQGVKDRLRILQLDVTEGEENIKPKIEKAVAFWGRIDVLVNNAGIGMPGLIEEGGSKLLRRQFETNFFGVIDVTTATLPHLRKVPGSCVVVIGSRSAWTSEIHGLGIYAASKAAVHAATESFKSELASFNINVLLVEPGAFRTEGINSQPYYNENEIPVYDQVRNASIARFAARNGTEKGDPSKAAEAIVDVVRGEGVAKGRPWPDFLFLGEDAEVNVRGKCAKILKTLDDWSDVTRGVAFD